jgi:hypothetical protein
MRHLLLLATAVLLIGDPALAASPPSAGERFSGAGTLRASATADPYARYRLEASLQPQGTAAPTLAPQAKQTGSPIAALVDAATPGPRFALAATLRDANAPDGGTTCGAAGVDIFKNGFE